MKRVNQGNVKRRLDSFKENLRTMKPEDIEKNVRLIHKEFSQSKTDDEMAKILTNVLKFRKTLGFASFWNWNWRWNSENSNAKKMIEAIGLQFIKPGTPPPQQNHQNRTKTSMFW